MKITWDGRTEDGRFAMTAWPDEFDAIPPVPTFYVDKDPIFFNDDILSVIAVLLFGEYCAGTLTLPRKVSPEVAQAMEAFLAPTWVRVSPIEFTPRSNSEGEGTVIVSESIGDWGLETSVWGSPRVSTICSLPSSEFSGYLISADGLFVGNNAKIIGGASKRLPAVAAQLAVGLLFAETFRANTIGIVADIELDGLEFQKLYNLLASAKISLRRMSPLQP